MGQPAALEGVDLVESTMIPGDNTGVKPKQTIQAKAMLGKVKVTIVNTRVVKETKLDSQSMEGMKTRPL